METKKIMIVDDDPALAELIGEFCSEAGYEARVVTDSLQALGIAVDWQPDLITLDLEMPDMDGVELLKRLKSRPQTKRIPVVVISIIAKAVLAEGGLKGARMVFEKPLKFQKLVSRLLSLTTEAMPPREDPEPAFEPYIQKTA